MRWRSARSICSWCSAGSRLTKPFVPRSNEASLDGRPLRSTGRLRSSTWLQPKPRCSSGTCARSGSVFRRFAPSASERSLMQRLSASGRDSRSLPTSESSVRLLAQASDGRVSRLRYASSSRTAVPAGAARASSSEVTTRVVSSSTRAPSEARLFCSATRRASDCFALSPPDDTIALSVCWRSRSSCSSVDMPAHAVSSGPAAAV